jgi:hypothetical protein
MMLSKRALLLVHVHLPLQHLCSITFALTCVQDLLGDSSIPSLEVSRRLEAVAARLKHLSPEQLDQVFDQDNEEAMRALTEAFNLRINTVSSCWQKLAVPV